MPLTPSGIASALAPALASAGMSGIAIPQYALGLGVGVCQWAQQIIVMSVDTGTLGVGTSTGLLLVSTPTLLSNLMSSFGSMGLTGVFVPALASGLASGFVTAFIQGLLLVSHPSVGVGASVNTFQSGPSASFIISGLASVGFSGTFMPNLATAIGLGLDTTFKTLILPLPIVGSVSPMSSTGTGLGKII